MAFIELTETVVYRQKLAESADRFERWHIMRNAFDLALHLGGEFVSGISVFPGMILQVEFASGPSVRASIDSAIERLAKMFKEPPEVTARPFSG